MSSPKNDDTIMPATYTPIYDYKYTPLTSVDVVAAPEMANNAQIFGYTSRPTTQAIAEIKQAISSLEKRVLNFKIALGIARTCEFATLLYLIKYFSDGILLSKSKEAAFL